MTNKSGSSRHHVAGACAVVALLTVVAWLITPAEPDAVGTVQVVAGRASAVGGLLTDRKSVVPANVPTFPSIPRFDDLTAYERQSLTLLRLPDDLWKPEAEKRLRSSIQPTMQGLALKTVYCVQGACQIIGTLNRDGRNQEDAVRQLLDGGVQRGIRSAGFVENGNMVIDADGDQRLRFLQYVALPHLIAAVDKVPS